MILTDRWSASGQPREMHTRPALVQAFQERFEIPKICEFYAHTEANAFVCHSFTLRQPDGSGALGHVGPFTRYAGGGGATRAGVPSRRR